MPNVRLLLCCVLTTCVTTVFFAPSASAAGIVVQQSLAKVAIGMTKAQVRAVRGNPATIKRGQNDFGPFTTFVYYRLTVTFQGNEKVTSVRTTRPVYSTSSGVGVGSTESELRAGLSGEQCRTEYGFRHCWIGRWLPGRRITDFSIRRGVVTSVTLGLVVD